MTTVPPPPPPDAQLPFSKAAGWSLGLAIGGLLCVGPFGSIPAVVLGHRALGAIRDGARRGRSCAIGGLVVGYIALAVQLAAVAAALVMPLILQHRADAARPPDRALHLRVEDPACSAPAVARVLEKRLKAARAQHRLTVPNAQEIEVRFASGVLPPEVLLAPGQFECRLVDPRSDAWAEQLLAGPPPQGFLIVEDRGRRVLTRAAGARADAPDPAQIGGYAAPDAETQGMLMAEMREGRKLWIPLLLQRRVELAGDALANASTGVDRMGRPFVQLKFTRAGAEAFHRLTADYAPGGARNPGPTRRCLAIIVDQRVYSAPMIRDAIRSGEAILDADFTLAEATALAALLGAGPLPCVPVIARDEPLLP